VRNCSTCTHRLCQKCCLVYQRIYPESTCTQKSHHPKLPAPTPTPASGSWSAIEALPATPDPATATATSAVDRDFFYDSTKPLHQAQYDAKMEARESFKAQREAVEERERQLEKLKQYVQILYWNQNVQTEPDSQFFRVECPQYPIFSLSHCSPEVRSDMGTTNNALLETYDLGAHRWIRIDSGSIMPIVNVQKLLVRARGVTSGRDMLLEDSVADADASREAATKKSPWPLKYVVDMARGFDAQKTMAGTVDDTFRAAFGMEPPKSRTTWAKHLKVWKYSTQAERDDFIAAGHARAGEWRAF
ncbi:hypothetical protein FIBSPDRAFT_686980, partial [Athelia psychrophila]